MISAERLNKILDILKEKKYVSINDLSQNLYVSKSTIRRDLIDLEKSGHIIRNRGGASLVSSNSFEVSSQFRYKENFEKKDYITNLALDFIENTMSICLDASSTVDLLSKKLQRFKKLILITNSVSIPSYFNDHEKIRVYSSGGLLKNNYNYYIGSSTEKFLAQFLPDLYIFSVKSIDHSGIYEAEHDQILIKRQMIKNSKMSILLVDSSKFDTHSFIKVSDLEKIDYIISDKKPKNFASYSDDIKKKFLY
uniref:DeoR/GlpR family DNA-binding transcription regulator n=1 Tax=Anaerococcus mediterraneensis TaxID=1870984 RepID=UPI00093202A0|nr:DeoR/GlpR family DNA-binding transcription regulator [Anaerococcus mediterraneensis]